MKELTFSCCFFLSSFFVFLLGQFLPIQFLQTIIEFYNTSPIDGAFFAILQNKLNHNDSKLLLREQKPVGLRTK